MLEVNTENLTNWINSELKSKQISISEELVCTLVNETTEIYKNQVLTLEDRTEALQIMQGLILENANF